MINIDKSPPPILSVPEKISVPEKNKSTRSPESVKESAGNLMGHAYQLLGALKTQNEGKHPEVSLIYDNAQQEIQNCQTALEAKLPILSSSINNSTDKEVKKLHKEVKNLQRAIKKAEQEVIHIISESQVKAVGALAQVYQGNVKKEIVEQYARGGYKAAWIYVLSWVLPTHWVAVNAFRIAHAHMEKASRQEINSETLQTKVDCNRWKEFENYRLGKSNLKQRAGVIGLNGIYRAHNFFSPKKIAKQLKSFQAQALSDQERVTLERDITIKSSSSKSPLMVTNKLVPLNKEFDKHIGIKGTLTAVFTNIFGTKGISSMNRYEGHLTNAWETNLRTKDEVDDQGNVKKEGKTLFRALRHAITSDILGSGKKRHKNSKKAAKELLKAALLQEITDQGLTLEEAAQKGIQLRLNSVSLVTPDDIRTLGSKTNNEKRMLLDQMKALHSFEGEGQTLTLDGVSIPIKLKANTFNFGVNAGAVGKLKVGVGDHKIDASFIKLGLELQYEGNKDAWKDLKEQINELRAIAVQPENYSTLAGINNQIDNLATLEADIEALMADKEAYLKGENQYEIGAKILNLTHVMDQVTQHLNKEAKDKKADSSKRLSGYKCAFNCKSGKDRTGAMDAIAKTYAIMAEQNGGRYFSHNDLQDPEIRKQFLSILVPLLLESGSLEITKTNTGVIGYKIQEEAQLGMDLASFLEAQGLSILTAG